VKTLLRRIKDRKQNSFFDENEQRVNQIVSKMFYLGNLTGPAIILARYFNIFPGVAYKPVIIFTILLLGLSIFQFIFSKKYPYSHVTKYISLGSLEFLVAFLSTRDGLCLFISYVFVTFLSCMYYNKRFTAGVSIVSYVVMIITLLFRSTLVIPEPADGLVGMEWFAAYGFGATIEFFVCFIISYNITKISRETLDTQHDQDQKIRTMQSQLITGFANLIESKDPTTGEHIKRTSKYVELISKKLRELGFYTEKLTDSEIAYMVKAAPLHDIGKMEIPDAILTKPGKLTPKEFELIQQHTLMGEKLIDTNLSNVEDVRYTEIAEVMALFHHEWWNGKGYPFHLIGNKIPLPARIMAAADVLDALLTVRPYKDAIPLDDTLVVMENLSGIQFDPAVITAVFALKEEIRKFIGQ